MLRNVSSFFSRSSEARRLVRQLREGRKGCRHSGNGEGYIQETVRDFRIDLW